MNPSSGSSKKKPVLVYVDDEPQNLLVTQIALSDYFEVITFSEASHALKELVQLQPKIILSDLKMPAMTGSEFLEIAQQVYPYAVRVIITGNSDDDSLITAIRRASLADLLKKPFTDDQLIEAMLNALSKYEREEEERIRINRLENKDVLEHPSWLHKISEQLRTVFSALPECRVTDRQIEEWSILIHLAMSAEKRYYHNTHHLFDIWDVKDPFIRLAILFHDVVYAQVDRNSVLGMLDRIVKLLKPPFLPNDQLTITLPDPKSLDNDDQIDAQLLYHVFGVSSGTILSTLNGMNEFLSARVAQKILSPVMCPWDVIQVMACIELTIPFRPKNTQGLNAPDSLLVRLRDLNQRMSFEKSENELVLMVERAVEVAHRDLWSFAAKDAGEFLNATWQLIIEGNLSLQKALYSPKDYRLALCKMEGFFSYLAPEKIFQKIESVTTRTACAELIDQSGVNLEAGRIYMRSKVIGVSVFEALDELTGGMAPIEIFRGDISHVPGHQTRSLEECLGLDVPEVSPTELNASVVELLKSDRGNTKIRYDLRNSPLAYYLYSRMTRLEFDLTWQAAQQYFSGGLGAMEYLRVIPRQLFISVGKSISQVATTRRVEILAVLDRIGGE